MDITRIRIERKPNLIHNGIKGWAIVWLDDYDAWYQIDDVAGIAQEVAFIRNHLATH